MPRLTINDSSQEVVNGKRLVLAIEDTGVKIGHRCGGNAKCTTCRVEFISGEPETMTNAADTILMLRECQRQSHLY